MGLRINSNIEAFNAHRNLMYTSVALSKSMEKLSSGLRINRAADDAAGLGISEKMRAQLRGLEQASKNVYDGISLVQTAEGAMGELHSILHRIRDLGLQYNNGVYSQEQKDAMVAEVGQLSAELGRMIGAASFNGIPVLSSSGPLATLQIGANDGETLVVQGTNVATQLGSEIARFAGLSGVAGATIDIAALDTAIDNISRERSSFGAVQNRLEHTANFLGVQRENLQSAESRIRDVDMAQEMMQFTRMQILQQSGVAMLAQANQNTASVLNLLK